MFPYSCFSFFHSSWDYFSSLSYCVFPSLVTFLQFLNCTFYWIRMPTLCLEDLKVVPWSLCSLPSNSLALGEGADCRANHGVCSISTEMRSSFTILKFLRKKLLLVTNSNSCSACLWFKYTALSLANTNRNGEGVNGYSIIVLSLSSAKVDVTWDGQRNV